MLNFSTDGEKALADALAETFTRFGMENINTKTCND